MKTKIKVSDTRQPALTRAVINQLGGTDSMEDICNHGVDGGFTGFIYYTDTVAFTTKHRPAILERMREDCESLGYPGGIGMMLATFNCLQGCTADELMEGLYNPDSDMRQTVYNALAWYAAEEISRELNPDL